MRVLAHRVGLAPKLRQRAENCEPSTFETRSRDASEHDDDMDSDCDARSSGSTGMHVATYTVRCNARVKLRRWGVSSRDYCSCIGLLIRNHLDECRLCVSWLELDAIEKIVLHDESDCLAEVRNGGPNLWHEQLQRFSDGAATWFGTCDEHSARATAAVRKDCEAEAEAVLAA